MRCATHPDVETNLRCGRCGKPICPKCLVQTVVGARCKDCARLMVLPTYAISRSQYIRATAVSLALAIALGFAWGAIWRQVPFIYINILIAIAVGYVIGELTSRSINRKRGRWPQVIGGGGVILSYVVALLSPWGLFFAYFDLLALSLGVLVVISRLRP